MPGSLALPPQLRGNRGGGSGGIKVFTKSLWARLMNELRDFYRQKQAELIGVGTGLAQSFLEKGIAGLLRAVAGNVLKFLGVSTIVGGLLQSAEFLWNFDWNTTDTQIDMQRQQLIQQGAGMLGGALGVTVGQVLCGQIANTLTFKIDPSMALAIRDEVSEEIYEEIKQEWVQTGRAIYQLGQEHAFYFAFQNARKAIKKNGIAQRVFGQEALDKWGEEGSKTLSLAQWQRDRIEDIENPNVREFVEEFSEELWQSCKEGFMVVADAIDSQMALNRVKEPDIVLGEQKFIEVIPNREEGTPYYFSTRENIGRNDITNFLANYQMMYEKDVGEIIEGSTPAYKLKAAHTISMKILWCNQPRPPLRRAGEPYKTVTMTIPMVKRSGWTWKQLKAACGGSSGIRLGKYKCWVDLRSGTNTCFSTDDKNKSERFVRDLFNLVSDDQIKNMTLPEKVKNLDNIQSGVFPEEMTVYPIRFWIVRTGQDRRGRYRLNDPNREKSSRKMSKRFELYYREDNPTMDNMIKEWLDQIFFDSIETMPRPF
ncbi:hypothetical protein BI308_25695 [Roseofilum reptotaenium AO1-A]|uniref:Uncharacterized protein n=1 Tax=Roseofilum reptotaenium AO1-A TaxID=1925591 RepID=A0A1L9QCD7_9CYAN|nr:hypothetical protein BI308_25695 [Roseofilum reptotaenium AO1-A]